MGLQSFAVTSLLFTKLDIPPVRSPRVVRPHLVARLRETRPVTVVIAPAGYGKTTLLTEWIDAAHLAVAWLSLDDGDNDPVRFWSYVVAALSARQAGLGEMARMLLAAPQPLSYAGVVSALCNDILALPQALTLVLDDYHVIAEPSVHAAVAYLIDHQPPNLRLVIGSRVDPPLPLPRLRARDQLREVRVESLRFTQEESRAFLTEVMGLRLTSVDVSALVARTEGWAAGLQLAALSLQGRPDPAAQIASFGGDHPVVADYLVDEVLAQLPVELQSALMRTAVADHVCAPLAATLLDQSSEVAQATLDRIEHANLFLERVDRDRYWFHYHQLFAQALRQRLKRADPDLARALHRRASEWFARSGQIAEALSQALAASAYADVAHLLLSHAMQELLEGRAATVLSALDAIPPEWWPTRPRLYVLRAATQVSLARYSHVEPGLMGLDVALATLPVDEAHVIASEQRALLAVALSFLIDPRALPLAQQALGELPAHSPLFALLRVSLSAAYLATGDLASARGIIEHTLAGVPRLAATRLLRLGLVTNRIFVLLAQGQLVEASDAVRALDAEMPDPPPPLPGVAFLFAQRGTIALHRNNVDTAEPDARLGLDLARATGDVAAELYALVTLALVYQARGDGPAAESVLREAEALARDERVARPLANVVIGVRGLLTARQGDRLAALDWLETYHDRGQAAASLTPYDWHLPARAWVMWACGQRAAARQELGALRAAAEISGHGYFQLWASVGLVLMADSAAEARAELGRALALAASQGYVRVFLDEGEPLGVIVRDWIAVAPPTDPHHAFARRLLAAFPTHPAPVATQRLASPLSPREHEVLGLIAAGLSNTEVAERLIVGVSTVKKHVNAIFAKLDVTHRAAAVARARDLGLL